MRRVAVVLIAAALAACATPTDADRRAQSIAWFQCVTHHEGWQRSPC